MASAGVASRRAAEKLIFDGKVSVNGATIRIPQTLVDPSVDVIKVAGQEITCQSQKVYYALNKPIGYHCTNAPAIKRRAVDLIETPPGIRLFTVGRLDKETSGLILVTNDGHFANRVMHPSGGVKKEYIAKVDQEVLHEHLVRLSQGCLVEGALVRPLRVSKIRKATIRITVQEGRRHEVRELLAAAGLEVLELKRVRIGELALGSLPIGQSRELTVHEIQRLFPSKEVLSEGSSMSPRHKAHPRSHAKKPSVG
jgi:23S rRNA pseudouridine2605 synthase